MFNTASPPLPTVEQIRDLRNDRETVILLLKLREELACGIRKLEPASLLALARQYHPEAETDYQAAAIMGLEATDALRHLAQHGEDVNRLSEAEKERLAPLVAAAGRRDLAIARELDAIGKGLSFIDARVDERRNKLIKAGVQQNEIDALIAQGVDERETRRAELNSQRQALLAEQEALGQFFRTGNEEHLPKDFKIVDVPRVDNSASPRVVPLHDSHDMPRNYTVAY